MGTKEQYDHKDAIHARANKQQLSPAQYEFAHVSTDDLESVAVDDYCRKCGDVTVHKLYAKSVADNGETECMECGHRELA